MANEKRLSGVFSLSELPIFYTAPQFPVNSIPNIFYGSSQYRIKSVFSLSEYYHWIGLSNFNNLDILKNSFAFFIGGYSQRDTLSYFLGASASYRLKLETNTFGTQSTITTIVSRATSDGVASQSNNCGYVSGSAKGEDQTNFSPSPGTNLYGNPLDGHTYLSSTEKVNFASTTNSNVPTANLSTPVGFLSSLETSTIGYFLGGYYQPSSSAVPSFSNIEKLSYASETFSLSSNKMVQQKDSFGTASDKTTKGYSMGGINSIGSTFVSSTEKLTYSTDTASNVSAASAYTAMVDVCGVESYDKTKGYFSGGITGYTSTGSIIVFPTGNYQISYLVTTSIIQKLTFSTDTRSNLSTNLTAGTTTNSNYISQFGTNVVAGDRGRSSAVVAPNYFLLQGGTSSRAYTTGPGGSYYQYDFFWYETEAFQYSTETIYTPIANSSAAPAGDSAALSNVF